MAVQETIQTTRQDPAIEAYRLGLLGDVQGYVKNQILGQNVQRLRGRVNPDTGQNYTDQEIVAKLGTAATGEEGEEGYVAASGPTLEQIQGISSEDMFSAPDYEVAGLSSGEQRAVDLAQSGIGSYQDYLDRGGAALGTATDTSAMGIGALAGTGQRYDPSRTQGDIYGAMDSMRGTTGRFDPQGVGAFMNPYEDAAVQQAMRDVSQAGEERRTGIGAAATAASALGGSRQAVENAKLSGDILREQGRVASGMRQAGYESAAARAQDAFERQQGRGQTAASQLGSLGLSAGAFGSESLENALRRQQQQASTYGSLASGLGQLGVQQGGLGEIQSGLNSQDLQNLMATGGMQRGVNQSTLDARRLSDLQAYTQPMQQYGFLSDIYSGVPTGSSVLTAASAPQVSPFQTAAGLGIAGLGAASGAQRAGLFG